MHFCIRKCDISEVKQNRQSITRKLFQELDWNLKYIDLRSVYTAICKTHKNFLEVIKIYEKQHSWSFLRQSRKVQKNDLYKHLVHPIIHF